MENNFTQPESNLTTATSLAIPVETIATGNGQSPHPVYTADRIQTIDIIRGFALLGILIMNIPFFGADESLTHTVLIGPHNTNDFRTVAGMFAFFNGTMRGLFSMLFGAGMVLFTQNKKERPGGPTVAEYYYRRLLWLVLFGVVNAYVFLWEGDILYAYGLLGMLLYPFRKANPKWLLVLGIVCIGIGHFKGIGWWNETREKRAAYVEAIAAEKAHKKLTEKQETAKAEWQEIEKNQQPDTAAVAKDVKEMRSGYGDVFNHLLPMNGRFETWGVYHGMWDMISMMFIGMAFFAWGFFSNKLSAAAYRMWLVVGYGVGIPIGWIFFSKGVVGANTNFALYVDSWRIPHWALYDVRRLLICIGHASLLMLVYRSKLVPWLMKAFACVGQMAFSNYLMQSIICTLFFFGYGFGYYNKLKYHQLYYVVGCVWVFQMIFSVIWLQYFRFGPFEWLWRSLTYWKKQPMLLRESKKEKDSEELVLQNA